MEYNILQIIQLDDCSAQYDNNVIALTLVRHSNGDKQLVYIAHDPASGILLFKTKNRISQYQ